VEEALAEAGITSEYRVSLAWESTADLDIYIENAATGEVQLAAGGDPLAEGRRAGGGPGPEGDPPRAGAHPA